MSKYGLDRSLKRERDNSETQRPMASASTSRRPPPASGFDSTFYNAEDDDGTREVGALDDSAAVFEKRLQQRGSRLTAAEQATKRSTYKNTLAGRQRAKDMDAWAENRMAAGGVHQLSLANDEDLDEGETCPVTANVVNPPFIAGGAAFTRQIGLVMPVKDSTSDFAKNAKEGSKTLREHREAKAKAKTNRETLDTTNATVNQMTRGVKVSEMTVEEADRLRRRARVAERASMSTEERVAADRTQQEKERERVRNEASYSDDMMGKRSGATEFSTKYTISEQRTKLPIYACRSELLRYIHENQVLVVAGETGSGKTTQLAQYLYEAGYGKHGLIGCTQPRRMAAVSVADRVSQEMGCALGETVGYAIRLEDKTSEDTVVKFMTDGVLLREVIRDRDLRKYSAVIMDEAHERSVNTDVLLGVLIEVLSRRADFKLIVTSATMDLTKFCTFFGHCPQYQIPGKVFPVELRYERSPVKDYVEQAVYKAIEVHFENTDKKGDILIFMTGQEDVECTCELITERLLKQGGEALAGSLMVLPCYSSLPSATQMKIRAPAPDGVRKCIVATNIVETSLTLDGVRFVIDSGYCKIKVFNPKIGMNALQMFPVSKAQARQRMGRAGRTEAGMCFRLYSEFQFDRELLPNSVPELQRTNLENVVLVLKSIGVKNLLNFQFVDPPPQENLSNSMLHLWMLGALDDKGDITDHGLHMTDFPCVPSMAKMLLSAVDNHGCGEEAVSLASMMSLDAKTVFLMPRGREDEAMTVREKFYVVDSDHLTLLNVYNQYRDNGCNKTWADDHFLNYTLLKRAQDIRVQFTEIFRQLRKKLVSCDGNVVQVSRALTDGFFPQAAKRRTLTEYITMITGVPCHLHPSSALNSAGTIPNYVVYNDFLLTTKEYMNLVTAVQPEWLLEASGTRKILVREDDDSTAQYNAMLKQATAEPGAVSGQGGESSSGVSTSNLFQSARQRAAASAAEGSSGGRKVDNALAAQRSVVSFNRSKAKKMFK